MKSKIISTSLVLVGFIIGATALKATADWSAPTPTPPATTCVPPNCNTDAPLNVGSTLQIKFGGLWIKSGLEVDGNLIVATGTPSKIGKVLTAIDDLGTVAWQTPASGGGSGVSGMNVYNTPGSNTWTKPSGAKFAKITVAGAGAGGIVVGGCGGGVCYQSGGGNGGLATKIVSLDNISTLAVTVGAKGIGSTNYGMGSTIAGNSLVTGNGVAITAFGGQLPLKYNSSNYNRGDNGTATGGDINFDGRGGVGQFYYMEDTAQFNGGTTGLMSMYLPEDGYVFIEYY